MRVQADYRVSPGAQIGRYRLDRRIHEDEISSVWGAQQDNGHIVAIRFFRPGEGPRLSALGSGRSIEDWDIQDLPELLHHRHLVSVIEVGEYELDHDQAIFYVVMEYYRHTLSAYLDAEGTQDERDALRLIKQISSGVAAMHSLDIVHQRLDPQHVLLDEAGQPQAYVSGFCLSLLTALDITQRGSIYAAPEVRSGGSPTKEANVYSLACIFLEMLAGESALGRVSHSLQNLRVSQETRSALARALRTNPSERYADAQAFLDALPLYLNVESIERPSRRVSPSFDPLMRLWMSGLAKWGVLFGLLGVVAAAPTWFWKQVTSASEAHTFYVSIVISSAVFAAVFATVLPRLGEYLYRLVAQHLFRRDLESSPPLFGRWREPVEAARDWLLLGLITGGLYWFLLEFLWTSHTGPHLVEDMPHWWQWRFPFILVSGAAGVLIARLLTIRSQDAVRRGFGSALVSMMVQTGIIAWVYRFIHDLMILWSKYTQYPGYIGWAAVALTGIAFCIVIWACYEDYRLSRLQRHDRVTGSSAGSGPVPMTITIIGGANAGKTAYLTAAYREWNLNDMGPLNIRASGAEEEGNTLLAQSGRNLYEAEGRPSADRWPASTTTCTALPFDLFYKGVCVARFSILDYPGGATVGNAGRENTGREADIQRFWNRIPQTDGLIMVADMSYVRRRLYDSDFSDVMKAYRKAMHVLIARNRRRRVIPIALVLTKCDEYSDPYTREVDIDAIEEGLEHPNFKYHELRRTWESLSENQGTSVVEYEVWPTSAITHSDPQRGPNGRPDLSLPYSMHTPAPPSLRPTNCAAPLLWMTAKVMRWNITLFRDFLSFVLGPTPLARQHIAAIEELERTAERLRQGNYGS